MLRSWLVQVTCWCVCVRARVCLILSVLPPALGLIAGNIASVDEDEWMVSGMSRHCQSISRVVWLLSFTLQGMRYVSSSHEASHHGAASTHTVLCQVLYAPLCSVLFVRSRVLSSHLLSSPPLSSPLLISPLLSSPLSAPPAVFPFYLFTFHLQLCSPSCVPLLAPYISLFMSSPSSSISHLHFLLLLSLKKTTTTQQPVQIADEWLVSAVHLSPPPKKRQQHNIIIEEKGSLWFCPCTYYQPCQSPIAATEGQSILTQLVLRGWF